MIARYFLFAALLLPCMMQSVSVMEPSHTFVINNGQMDLVVNGISIPASPMGKKVHQVPVTDLTLIVTVPNDEKAMQKIKLLPADLGNTIKIGGYYNQRENRYIVSILRSNHIPLLFQLKQLNKRLSLPRRL